jgi:hypothetical protein
VNVDWCGAATPWFDGDVAAALKPEATCLSGVNERVSRRLAAARGSGTLAVFSFAPASAASTAVMDGSDSSVHQIDLRINL